MQGQETGQIWPAQRDLQPQELMNFSEAPKEQIEAASGVPVDPAFNYSPASGGFWACFTSPGSPPALRCHTGTSLGL